jgi:hypothetical protein
MFIFQGARGSAVGWGTMLHAGRSRVQIPMRWIYFNLRNPSSRTVALGLTQPLIGMSTRNIPGGGRCVRLTTLPPCVSRLSRENVGASTSHNSMRLHGLLQGQLYIHISCWFELYELWKYSASMHTCSVPSRMLSTTSWVCHISLGHRSQWRTLHPLTQWNLLNCNATTVLTLRSCDKDLVHEDLLQKIFSVETISLWVVRWQVNGDELRGIWKVAVVV